MQSISKMSPSERVERANLAEHIIAVRRRLTQPKNRGIEVESPPHAEQVLSYLSDVNKAHIKEAIHRQGKIVEAAAERLTSIFPHARVRYKPTNTPAIDCYISNGREKSYYLGQIFTVSVGAGNQQEAQELTNEFLSMLPHSFPDSDLSPRSSCPEASVEKERLEEKGYDIANGAISLGERPEIRTVKVLPDFSFES